MSAKIQVCFTVSQMVADWLKILKKERHINRSAYVDNLILRDMQKQENEEDEK